MAEPDTTPEPRPLSLLARETFGNAFHGDVPEPTEESADEPADEPAGEPGDDAAEDEVADAAEPAPSEDNPDDGDPDVEDDAETITSLSELVEHFELDPEWANGLKVPVKIDGEPAEASLSDLVANYQMDGAAEKRLDKAKARAGEIVSEAQRQAEQVQAQFAVAAELIKSVEATMTAEFDGIDWKQLREDDPAEYAARKADMDQARGRIDAMKQDAAAKYREAVQGRAEETRQQQNERLQAEQDALLEKIPDWKDPEKANAEKAKLADYLIGEGFTRDDVMAASDHRLIVMAHKARMFDEIQANSNAARKKVAKVPKVVKPGAPKPPEQKSREQEARLKSRLKKSGRVEDAFALLKAKRRQ